MAALASRRVEIDPASLGVMLNLAGLRPVTFSAGVLEAHIAEKPAWMVEVADGLKPLGIADVQLALEHIRRIAARIALEHVRAEASEWYTARDEIE